MVLILDEAPSFGSQIGRSLGQGVGSAGAALAGTAMQKREDKLLKEKYGIDVAGFRGNTRKAILGEELKTGTKRRVAEASLPTNNGNGQIGTIESSLGGASNTQESSSSRHILSDIEIEKEGERLSRASLRTANPITLQQGIQLAEEQNARNINYRNTQNTYGSIAENELSKVLPDASAELQKVFAGKGEEYLRQNISDTEAKRRLATDAKNLKNKIATLQKDIGPKRIFRDVKNALLNRGLSADKAKNSIRAQLLPLKEELGPAYYSTARNILAETGRQPEEVEELITNLGEGTEKILGTFQSIPNKMENTLLGGPLGNKISLGKTVPLDEKETEKFTSNLEQVLQNDPSTNLILLRKAYEDKGVDWRTFKGALDDMILNGKYKPKPEERLGVLDNPPLDRLDQILHHFKLTGR